MDRKLATGAIALAIMAIVAGCSSSGSRGSGTALLPTTKRSDWTPAGLAAASAAATSIAKALPGECAQPGPNDFKQFPISMKQFKSRVVPTGQILCYVGSELLEISAFANTRDRDQFVDDRSNGVCDRSKAQAVQYHKPLQFPGLRWVVGAGNLTVQPDSEGVARRLSSVTKGTYVARQCAKGITIDWDPKAAHAMEVLGKRIAASGKGCNPVELIGRETLLRSRELTKAQLPAALGQCVFADTPIELLTFSGRTPQLDDFIQRRISESCGSDPALGRINGRGYMVLARGTIAEQVAIAAGGKLADTACGAPAKKP